jgi:lipopolysaccharide transport system ATP-binding protein
MHPNPIIVENVSKRYLLGHHSRSRGNYKYTALRDVIAREARSFARKASDFFTGRQILHGDEVEEFWALKGVSFEVKPGEVVGIVGRNGAGKSTLLKILSRITEPTEGRVLLRGRVASLLEVGTGFHPELTGRENIFLNGAVLGMTKREILTKFDEIVAFAEVEKFLDTPVKHYSSGMYVRLAFAVAAHLEPEILIIDEVLAVGDIQFQKKCLGKMQGVVNEGRTVLFVSHQTAAVNQLCRNVIWLDQGKIVEYGEVSAVLPKYLSADLSNAAIATFQQPKINTGLFFHQVSILNQEGVPSTELDAQYPFTIRLNYEVSEPLTEVELDIRVRTIDGVAVFTTVYSHYSDVSKMDKTAGSYVASVQIPALFLMPGDYTIRAAAYQYKGHYHPLHALDTAIRFKIWETGTKMAKHESHQKAIGVVLVDFRWTDEQLTPTPALRASLTSLHLVD